jgi:prolyl oligopeptidase
MAGCGQTAAEDPYAYLEEIEGEEALAFARAENERSLPVLQGDPRYDDFYDQALAIVAATDRIPPGGFAGEGRLRGFWQDETHVRGIWRETTRGSYASASPQWRTILDLDALAEAEDANWVWDGAFCLPPQDRHCLIQLSDGGKDAAVLREFDAQTGEFVDGGFYVPEAKQDFAWLDADTLIVGTDWGEGSLTQSGYPYIAKRWARGTPLDEAKEIFRGERTDVSAGVSVLRDADGVAQGLLGYRGLDFFNTERSIQVGGEFKPLALPKRASLQGFLDGQVIFTLESDWEGTDFVEGDLISIDLEALKADPQTTDAALVLRPSMSQSIEAVTTTRGRLVVALYENVMGGLYAYAHDEGGWSAQELPLPEGVSVSLQSAADADDALLVTVANFLTPTTQYLIDAASGARTEVRTLPARFDASAHVVEQYWATSSDGTEIPYFVVRPKDLAFDGQAPTLLYAYGGFQVSETPGYSGTVGKLWLENGGVYVVANIRGGGEFGPRWHNAGLKLNRQQVFDDFFAVSEDLIARNITSPEKLGAMGGSNGGLLMGVALTQRPELYNAIVIQVPLFDMIGYTRLGAGASWVGEYGDPAIPQERAFLETYSPYQNLRADQSYPLVYIETSTKDDRVHPGHARKAAARLKELGYDYLYYENIDGGHSAAANLIERARRSALEFTYLTQRLMD